MKIKITQDYNTMGGNVFIYWENYQGIISILQPDMKTVEDLAKGAAATPTFNVPNFQEFINAMGEAVMEYGYKGNKEAKNEGSLEATKYHLEDLRKLLKL